MRRPSLPRLAVAVVEWIVPDPVARAGLLGDLEERYGARRVSGSIGRGVWLLCELLAITYHYGRKTEGGGMDTLRQDLAFALRGLARRPGFAALVVLTLALGIGANAAIFSVVDGLLLEPLSFDEGHRLAIVNEREESGFTASVSFPNYRDWKERSRSFDRFSIILPGSRRFVSSGSPRIVEVGHVGGGFFETLGTEPALGRYFTESETEPGADRLVVLDHAFWSEAFGADTGVIGRSVELSGEPFTVVGVAPPDFLLYEETMAFLPLGIMEARLPWNDRGTSVGAEVVARLTPGATFDQARGELAAIGAAIAEETGEVTGIGNLTPLRERLVGDTGRQSLLLMAAVGLVLLVACANVANLLFVSSERRAGEIALRSALGASRGRIHRQLLTESLVIGLLGGIGGLALSVAGLDALLRLIDDVLPAGFADRIRVDGDVLLFTAVLSLGTATMAGFLPALRAAGSRLSDRLRQAANGASGAGRARAALVASEVAFSMVLLTGAGLLIATLSELQDVEKGWSGRGVLTLRIQTPDDQEESREIWAGFHARVREHAAALPGVSAVSTSNHFPLSGNSWEMLYRDEQTPPDDRGESVLLTMVSPSFFDAWDVPILEGRGFTDSDRWGAEPVAIVDETLAATRWPDESALGKRVTFEKVRGADGEEVDLWRTVVGVARHVRHYELTSPSRIEVYTPLAQSNAWGFTSYLSVRTASDPASLTADVRGILRELEPDATLYRIRTAESLIDQELGLHRAMRELLVVMAGLALLLGCVGIYSVVSHTTALRLRELSLRIALGGAPGRITRLVVRESMVPIVIGVAFGTAGAVGLGRLLRSILYEVGPADPVVMASSATLLLLVATVSAWLPARRASRVPPQAVLRGE